MSKFLKNDETVKNAVNTAEGIIIRTKDLGNGMKLVRRPLAYYSEGELLGMVGAENLEFPDSVTVKEIQDVLKNQGVEISISQAVNARLDGKFRNAAQYVPFTEHDTIESLLADVHIIPFDKLKKDRVTIASNFDTFKTLYGKESWYSDFTASLAELYVTGKADKKAIDSLMGEYIAKNVTVQTAVNQ